MRTRTILNSVKEYFDAENIQYVTSTKAKNNGYAILGVVDGYHSGNKMFHMVYHEDLSLELNIAIGKLSSNTTLSMLKKAAMLEHDDLYHSKGTNMVFLRRSLEGVNDTLIVPAISDFIKYYFRGEGVKNINNLLEANK